MTPAVVVSGVGVVSPAGVGLELFLHAAFEGHSLAAVDTWLKGCPVEIACRLSDFVAKDHGIARANLLDRYTQFALVSADEAMRQAGHTKESTENARLAVILGSGAGGVRTFEEQHRIFIEDGFDTMSPMVLPAGLLNMAAGQVAIRHRATGPCLAPCTACASGATAIGLAKQMLERDEADIVIAGGAEAPIAPMFTSAFARMGTLSRAEVDPAKASRPFDRNRDGFVIGEGAALMVLERADDVRARGGTPRVTVAGYGSSADAHHVTTPDPRGAGAIRAMRAAIADAGISASDIDYVNAHGTSTRYNDSIEANAITEVLGEGTLVSSTKGVFGHALGAAAALEAVLAAATVKSHRVPPTANLVDPDDACVALDMVMGSARETPITAVLSNSFGFGGQNASLLFTSS
ncbi:beta-ketoacyl-[acyl-carrier-protein] synthase family protein [Rhodococcus coprophilus]|uniref:3-oxoacyl-ACP synthase II n=1 Tax=Rhodococcus coprophilus TaxID=38310 RepID=A0A2X4TN17_9NOCA|nr:beta-ketoacyl-[acyl-carrier-protein] synthase family protein [Rhodococcus coprophilus]MBM7460774.1 3-oxoacyl-[acyl-carrier-protein] synthase II [Rhodococcus coprophilus]SQI28581.1 3-oxoacyl-ACP synthase II [Rhodococcus coprophilus]